MPTIATATLQSITPVGFSKHYQVDKLTKELPKDYETRTWREKTHYDKMTGQMYIPATMFKQCIMAAAKYLSMQIPGKGKSTYTKHFEAGVMCVDNLMLPVKKDDCDFEWLFVPSDGRRGGTTRVDKCFPVVHQWNGDVIFHIVDSIITKDVFHKHLIEAGSVIGIGRFRPRQGGTYGRFIVNKLEWNHYE